MTIDKPSELAYVPTPKRDSSDGRPNRAPSPPSTWPPFRTFPRGRGAARPSRQTQNAKEATHAPSTRPQATHPRRLPHRPLGCGPLNYGVVIKLLLGLVITAPLTAAGSVRLRRARRALEPEGARDRLAADQPVGAGAFTSPAHAADRLLSPVAAPPPVTERTTLHLESPEQRRPAGEEVERVLEVTSLSGLAARVGCGDWELAVGPNRHLSPEGQDVRPTP